MTILKMILFNLEKLFKASKSVQDQHLLNSGGRVRSTE